MAALFIISALFVLYTYVGYPFLIALRARWVAERAPRSGVSYPPVAILIPAFNEECAIGPKVRNALAADYPGPLRVVVVSDGSTDATVALARAVALEDQRVQCVVLTLRSGKMTAVNRGMEEIVEPIVVLTDAEELFAPDAVRRLAAWFADPLVGAVSGSVHRVDATTGFAHALGAYWTYESWLRRNESRSGSTVGVSGAIYAVRRSCYRNVPADTILDDVALPFEILRQGYRVKHEAGAVAFEYASTDAAQEYLRKRRTLAGNYQLISRYWDLLQPFGRGIAFRFWSHKVFRLLVPYALLGAFVGTFGLPPGFRALSLLVHGLFYGLALFVFLAPRRLRMSLLSVPYTFCMLNWAALVGSYDYWSGRQRGLWERAK